MASIELNNVCLDYIIKAGLNSLGKIAAHLCSACFRSEASQLVSIKHSSYRALNAINLKINNADRVGLIGQNGAGKSTLLRVLARIYRPNMGSVIIKGNVASVFDVGLGINHEATGYQNIINLGIMRGLTKRQAYNMIDDVAIFTGLENHLNQPVRTFSAGMQMKLAFAISTAFSPEILLIDEIIGVGDSFFIKKATDRLNNAIDNSQILVLASHSNDIIRQFCNKVIVLEQGEIKYSGEVEEGLAFYGERSA